MRRDRHLPRCRHQRAAALDLHPGLDVPGRGVRVHAQPNLELDRIGRVGVGVVEVIGEVPDAAEFMGSKAVMIVPLFSGSGIRIKIIEGMALGKAIISTDIGAEGINYTNNENIKIANDPDGFLKAIEECFTSVDYCNQLGHNARELIKNEYSLEMVSKKLEEFYVKVLEKN